MVNLVSRLFHSHHRGRPSSIDDTFEFQFQGFCRDVSKFLDQLMRSEAVMSLTWIHRCLETLREVNRAFAKLAVGIDLLPITQMAEDDSIEGYLNYTLNLLEFLNSISSSLSHLRHARLCSSHALTLLERSPQKAAETLRGIRFRHFHRQLAFQHCEANKRGSSHSYKLGVKEEVIRRALTIVSGIGYWVCGLVLTGLSGDASPYLDVRRRLAAAAPGGFDFAGVAAVDDIVAEGNGLAREMRDVDCVLGRVVAAADCGGGVAAEELRRKLEEMESVLDSVGKEAEEMFSEILAGRIVMMDCFRRLNI